MGSLRQLEHKTETAFAQDRARIVEGFPEQYYNLFRQHFCCSKLKERIQLKFIVALQFSCSESVQQLNNRSTQIIFFLNSLILL